MRSYRLAARDSGPSDFSRGENPDMREDPLSEGLLARYLLGDLSEKEQVEIEERAFVDPQYLGNLQAVESDLIDEYVRGGLSKNERRLFEDRFFASAERRRKIEFARAFATVAPEFRVSEAAGRHGTAGILPLSWRTGLGAVLRGLGPVPRYAIAAAAMLILVAASWLVAESFRMRGQLAQLRSEQQSRARDQEALQRQFADEQARGKDLSAQLEREREQRQNSEKLVGELQRQLEESSAHNHQSAIVSLALLPGIARSGGTRPKLVIPQSARLVRVEVGVEPEDDYKTFRVELLGPGGQPVWTGTNLSATRMRGGRGVALNLPARSLIAGQYELALKGVTPEGKTEDIGYHYFEVLRK